MNPERDVAQPKIYFLSDFHLGARHDACSAERERKVVRFLDSIKEEATAVYLLGDILDFWYEYREVVPRGFTRFFGKVAELSDRGVEIHWFTGNHDIWIFDYLPRELGITVHRGMQSLELYGKRFLLAHGDDIDNRSAGFRLVRWVFNNRVCQRLFSAIHPRWSVAFAHRWSSHSRHQALSAPETYTGEEDEYLVRYAKRKLAEDPGIDYFIFGHRHVLLDLQLTCRSRIVILGDWITYFSYAVFDGEQLSVELFESE